MRHTLILFLLTVLINYGLYSQDKMDIKAVTAKELKELKKKGQLDNELSNKYHVDIYRLENGKALVDFENEGHIYPSIEGLVKTYDEIYGSENERTYHILEGRFPYDHNYTTLADSIANDVLTKLGVEEFNYKLISLKKVDSALNGILNSTYPLDEIYPGLVAVVGKVLINEVPEGKWEMFKPEGEEVWEPYVVDKQKRNYNPFLLVYKELYEYYLEREDPVALFDHAQIELIQHDIDVN